MTQNAVGTGPFKLDRRVPDEIVSVVAFDDYWGGRPYLDRINFRVVPDPSTLRLLLLTGEIDMVTLGLTWTDIDDLALHPEINVLVESSFPEIRILTINVEREPFDDVRVRQALNYAIDFDALIAGVLRHNAVRMISPIPAGTFGHNPDVNAYSYDPERARQLLAEAGYPNGFTFELQYPTADIERQEFATVVQANLRDIGVTAELAGYAWGPLLERWEQGDFQVLTGKWAPSTDPHFRLSGILHCNSIGAAGNYGRYCNAAVSQLLDGAVQEADVEARAALYAQLQNIVLEDAPWVFGYQPVRAFPMRRDVKGFAIPSLESFDWRFVSKGN
jgi:peptide/nickel transport system substrate-binding protein